MNKSIKIFAAFIIFGMFNWSCTSQQIATGLSTASDILNATNANKTPTSTEVGSGLKEALIKGISNGVVKASAVDGYFKNDKLRIPFPPEAQNVADKLRQIGLGKEVAKFEQSLNRGAEEAAKSAKSIFIDAIRAMTIQDAFALLRGEKDAATKFLRTATETKLKTAFSPIVENALGKTNATKNYSDIVNTYNKIPFVKKANPDLKEYATQKAIDGLFILVAEEEGKIRANPLQRTTDLLKRVFALQDKK